MVVYHPKQIKPEGDPPRVVHILVSEHCLGFFGGVRGNVDVCTAAFSLWLHFISALIS